MVTQVDSSKTESRILGLKTGRCNHDFFDPAQLYQSITQNSYDLCRLKVPAEDEFAAHRLHQTGLPAFFSGSIRRYQTKITTAPEGSYNYPDLVWEYYDGTQQQLLKDMLRGTWGTYPIGYYRTPYLSELVNKEVELESLFCFYKEQNNPHHNPDNTFVFIKHGDNYVGFFALNKLNGNLESHVGGILEPYRKGGYFLDKLRYIKHYCLNNHLQHFIFGARNENAGVQRIFQYVGFQPIGCENVFHIAPLLSHTAHPVVVKEISHTAFNTTQLQVLLLNAAMETAAQHLPAYKNVSVQVNNAEVLLPHAALKLQFSFPVITGGQLLMVIKSTHPAASAFTAYFSAQV